MLEGIHVPSGPGTLQNPTEGDGKCTGKEYAGAGLQFALTQIKSIKLCDLNFITQSR